MLVHTLDTALQTQTHTQACGGGGGGEGGGGRGGGGSGGGSGGGDSGSFEVIEKHCGSKKIMEAFISPSDAPNINKKIRKCKTKPIKTIDSH